MASTHSLSLGDQIVVTRDGQDLLMTVFAISPPMSLGRALSAGPAVTASLKPGGYAVTFDDRSTFLEWRPA